MLGNEDQDQNHFSRANSMHFPNSSDLSQKPYPQQWLPANSGQQQQQIPIVVGAKRPANFGGNKENYDIATKKPYEQQQIAEQPCGSGENHEASDTSANTSSEPSSGDGGNGTGDTSECEGGAPITSAPLNVGYQQQSQLAVLPQQQQNTPILPRYQHPQSLLQQTPLMITSPQAHSTPNIDYALGAYNNGYLQAAAALFHPAEFNPQNQSNFPFNFGQIPAFAHQRGQTLNANLSQQILSNGASNSTQSGYNSYLLAGTPQIQQQLSQNLSFASSNGLSLRDSGCSLNNTGTWRDDVALNIRQQANESAVEVKHETSGELTTSGASSGQQSDESALSGNNKRDNSSRTDKNKSVEYNNFLSYPLDNNGIMVDMEKKHYVEVPARLAGKIKKYCVSLAEIHRRISSPETLNTSALCGILRKAKSRDGGKEFRKDLEQLGFKVACGRRKTGPATIFSNFCEGEAVQMSKDFEQLAKEYFPISEVATNLISQSGLQVMDAKTASSIVRELINLLNTGVLHETQPLNYFENINNQPNNYKLDNTTLNGLKKFSRYSHCFGNRAMQAAWNTIASVLTECEKQLQGEKNSEVAANFTAKKRRQHQHQVAHTGTVGEPLRVQNPFINSITSASAQYPNPFQFYGILNQQTFPSQPSTSHTQQ